MKRGRVVTLSRGVEPTENSLGRLTSCLQRRIERRETRISSRRRVDVERDDDVVAFSPFLDSNTPNPERREADAWRNEFASVTGKRDAATVSAREYAGEDISRGCQPRMFVSPWKMENRTFQTT